MTTEEIIKDIKKELRSNMNGVASTSMREKGLNYRINFGIEIPRLRDIAKNYEPNHEVAQRLWHEEVRESKILAGILMPTERFFPEIANIWVDEITNPEIAQMTVMNLFSRLPYSSEKAFEWMASEIEMKQLCGFLLITRLLMQGQQMNERAEEEFLDQAAASFSTDNLALKKAIYSALNYFIDYTSGLSTKRAKEIIKNISQ